MRLVLSMSVLIIFLSNPDGVHAASRRKQADTFGKALSSLVRKNPVKFKDGMQSTDPYASKRLIVKTKTRKINLKKYGASTVLKGLDGVYIMQFRTIKAAKKAERKLKKLKNIIYVEPDRLVGVTSTKVNSSFSQGVEQIGMKEFCRYVSSRTKETIKVAVVDTGIAKHPRLNARFCSGIDVCEWKKTMDDTDGHGTHVAGIIVDSTPGLNVQIMPIRVSEDEDILETELGIGIWYAVENGAKVINLSLGYEGKLKYIEDMIDYAVKKDCVVVVSAGNGSIDINKSDIGPAYMKNVITVGAVDGANRIASFSNYGKALDVVAPGKGIRSTWIGGHMKRLDGTSMAAPYVSAAAAVYRLLYPQKKASEICKLIKQCTLDLGSSGWDKKYGYGLIQAPTSFTKLSLDMQSMLLSLGEQKTLSCTVQNNYLADRKITWATSDKSIASVKNGVVTGVKAGVATISASSCGKTITCKVTVKNLSLREKAFQNYVKVLKKNKILYNNSTYTAFFGVINQDNNDIPELVVADTAANHNSFTLLGVNGTILDTYDLYDVSAANHSIAGYYYPRTGLLYSMVSNNTGSSIEGVQAIVDYQYVYLNSGTTKLVSYPDFPVMRSDWIGSNNKTSSIYTQNNSNRSEKINKALFDGVLTKYVGKVTPILIRLYKNTEENRIKYLK